MRRHEPPSGIAIGYPDHPITSWNRTSPYRLPGSKTGVE